MSLTVLSVAFPFAPVGPKSIGGAEQVLTELDRALVAAGHTSLVLACEGSQTAGKLFPVHLSEDSARNHHSPEFQSAMDQVLDAHRVDLVHMHGFDFHQYRLPAHIPILVTLHLPVAWYPQSIWTALSGNLHLQCVSQSQLRSCPPEFRNLPVIANGIALSPPQGVQKSDFALVLGRICPEKNQHAALQAGTLAGTRVLLGGQIFPYPEHERYFHEKIKPLLRDGHEFLGPLPPARKQELLATARCLLHPTLAPETSSLVAMEALAAATPVLAYRSGALPEIVDEGVTGFLIDTPEEMASAIAHLHTIHPEACRAAAEQRFSRERMVREYFSLYRSLVHNFAPELLHV